MKLELFAPTERYRLGAPLCSVQWGLTIVNRMWGPQVRYIYWFTTPMKTSSLFAHHQTIVKLQNVYVKS